MTQLMTGKEVAEKLIKEMANDLSDLSKRNIIPHLGIVRVGEDPGSLAYENSLKKRFSALDLEVSSYHFSKEMKEEAFLKEFDQINQDEEIHGVLVLRPLPDHLDTNKVSQKINPVKDVDGMSPTNLGKILLNDEDGLISATPAGVMKILDFYAIDLEGKDVVIIGHSEVVGKPLSILMLNRNATVTVTHIYSKNIKEMASQADILITATGVAGLVTKDYVKEGAVVIDVGISRIDGEIKGDVKYDEVADKVSQITPVPGGVGAVTTMMLASNLMKATKLLIKKEKNE
ncbi:MAG: bifunctional 5,10-methylenetetrahydrofolate dehydrogenase/5,10-methenyltetrahydrofolate cyclohydrolase [Atopostipes suicloacalis]|nr:bifunctional 5,10-methylenetetrahydrofolate dehydrogenase/5,10-methenyltetrahydrofolate cyclohydrolase [Atopostipes suicloacalis]MDN6730581.1 bifunctional 5,10-methylenetetrahydrofolate dehydrogenase/5,10-methenyltetrahydrofolate cyclohydrolase [Atopostipes suicloacalis]